MAGNEVEEAEIEKKKIFLLKKKISDSWENGLNVNKSGGEDNSWAATQVMLRSIDGLSLGNTVNRDNRAESFDI